MTALACLAASTVTLGMLPSTAATAAVGGQPKPNVICHYEEQYSPNVHNSDEHIPVSPLFQNVNNTPNPATNDFVSTATGTVSLTVSASATVSSGVIVAGVSATFGISASVSLAITTTNGIHPVQPAWSTIYAQYGVWRSRTAGTYSKFAITPGCSSTSFAVSLARVPKSIGWNVWLG